MGVFVWEDWFEVEIPSHWESERDAYFVSLFSARSDYSCVVQVSCHEIERSSGDLKQRLGEELYDAAEAAGFRIVSDPETMQIDGRLCLFARAKKGRRHAQMWAAGDDGWYALFTLTYAFNSPGVESGRRAVEGVRFLR